eukprot:5432402-Ditylum_brightwellii.AAC.2
MERWNTTYYTNERRGKTPCTNQHANIASTDTTTAIESVPQDGTHSVSFNEAILLDQAGHDSNIPNIFSHSLPNSSSHGVFILLNNIGIAPNIKLGTNICNFKAQEATHIVHFDTPKNSPFLTSASSAPFAPPDEGPNED